MEVERMPFLTGPARVDDSGRGFNSSQPSDSVVSVVPLSKTQLALWLDYLRRPSASHYLLTLEVDLSSYEVSMERIMQTIHNISCQHPMLRTTFHVDPHSADISKSFMAVHNGAASVQDIQIAYDSARLHDLLRSGFDLSISFPVRWVISIKTQIEQGKIKHWYSIFLVGHHIAVDGSAMSHISKQLLSCFEASPVDEVAKSVPSGPSYGDYVHEQDAYLRSSAGDAARKFWLSQIEHTQPFEWTIPAPKSSVEDYRSINTWCFLPNEELKAWSNSYGTSVNSALLMELHSWFRIATSVIGLITAGASTPTPHHDHALSVAFGGRPKHFTDCISHMANTVSDPNFISQAATQMVLINDEIKMPIKFPLSSMLQDDATFNQTVKAMGKNLSAAKKHELYPFISLMQEAQKTMDNSLLNFKVAVTFSPKLASKKFQCGSEFGNFETSSKIVFCFLEQDDGVSLGVIVNPQVFDAQAVASLKRKFMDTVSLSQRNPSFKLSELAFLWNRQLANIPAGPQINDIDAISSSRVFDWISTRAQIQPDAVALYSAEQGRSVKYRDMCERSHQIAQYLQRRGIQQGDAVLLMCDRGFELVLWIIGILEAGAYFVVIDKDWPQKRREAIMRVAEPKAVVADTHTVECPSDETVLIIVDDVKAQISQMSKTKPEVVIQDDDLAYTVFTSGSTGQPKGVMVEHANLSHYVSAARSVVKVGPYTRVLQFASFAFDASILEWAATLSYGGTLCFVDHPRLLVGEYLTDVIKKNQINFFHTTPSVLSTISKNEPLPSLRLISVGGEPSPPGLLAHWGRKLQLLHAYGPTETTVIVTVEPIPELGGITLSGTPDPTVIGRVFPNSSILICSEDSLEALPTDSVGEICIAGPQVSRGYKGQTELTNSKFHQITVSGRPTRLYRTGDRGYLTADGKVCIGGRMNNREIKVRGYRVDLHEVEQSILAHNEEVTMTSVQLVDDSLVALVVPITASCDTIRQRLLTDVPSYAVPSQIISTDSLPLNPNGKVDHNQTAAVVHEIVALKDPAVSSLSAPAVEVSSDDESEPLGVKTPSEEMMKSRLMDDLQTLWAKVLVSTRQFSPNETFFDAGGHSLSLIKLHGLISEQFPTASLSLLDIFGAATIKKQAEKILPALQADDYASYSSQNSSGLSSPAPGRTGTSTPATSIHSDPNDGKFAIIGMSCSFPGGNSLTEFWDVLMNQRDGVTTSEQPAHLSYELGKDSIFVPRHGTIDALSQFNPEAWSMSQAEADALDPQKRVFLDVASKAIKDAGLKLSQDTENNIGVYVGAADNTYNAYMEKRDGSLTTPQTFESHYKCLLDPTVATLAAYKLNLTGPNVTMNTACSSSLTALSLALTAIRDEVCDTALVGGTSIAYPQEGGYVASQGQVFSPTGQCLPFDSRADGSMPADGVTAIVVKSLSAAMRDGNPIYAVIEGHAIGSDGMIEKAGFTVPSSAGQSRTIARAIRNSGISLETLRYVETHGSGTSWGDALEIQGLRKALDSLGQRGEWSLRVGSNKGNFGNAEAASGLLSLIKASLGLTKSVIPPLRELKEPNVLCGFDDRVEPLMKPLRLDTNARVGVTSLGFGGSNAHMILASPGVYGMASRVV
ncbi:non-ribosomal peptide synthetase [Xylariaceae sp. FL0255]|nr:non-ribosomal peptide synthetase [Xylariaceae sp. FL0255]